MPNVNLSPYSAEQAEIDRRRKYAELMQQQSMQPIESPAHGRFAVPISPFQGLAKMAQAGVGAYGQSKADERTKALAERMRGDASTWAQNMPQGTPATPASLSGESGDELFTPGTDAAGPDRNKLLAHLMQGGQNPATAPFASAMLTHAMKMDDPYSLSEGEKRMRGSMVLAENPKTLPLHFGNTGTALQGMDQRTGVPVGPATPIQPTTMQNDPNKPFMPDGTPNTAYQQFSKDRAKAGKTDVQVRTDVKTGESLAGQIGPMMKDSTTIAEGAVKQVDAARRIVQAIETGKIFAGPGATPALLLTQVGQVLGVGGKDDAEKIANTRGAIRGLAELTLQGRQQMKGQGAITESEGKLAEKAMSGDFSELTAPEIRQLAKASERAARFNYAEHARKLEVMKANPNLQGVAPFYQGPSMPDEVPQGLNLSPRALEAVRRATGGGG